MKTETLESHKGFKAGDPVKFKCGMRTELSSGRIASIEKCIHENSESIVVRVYPDNRDEFSFSETDDFGRIAFEEGILDQQ